MRTHLARIVVDALQPPTPPELLAQMNQTLSLCQDLRDHALWMSSQGDVGAGLHLLHVCSKMDAEARGVVADWEQAWMERQLALIE